MSKQKEKPSICVAVLGTGWPEGTLENCSSITRQLLKESAVPLAKDYGGAPLMMLGGVGKAPNGEGLTEAERARKFLEERHLVRPFEQNENGESKADIVSQTRTSAASALTLYTDCDPDFTGKPSTSTAENAENAAIIIQRLRNEGCLIEELHLVTPDVQIKRAIEVFRKKLMEAGLSDIEIKDASIRVKYEPKNAQMHWRSHGHRQVWEAVRKAYSVVARMFGGEEQFDERLKTLKKKLKLI